MNTCMAKSDHECENEKERERKRGRERRKKERKNRHMLHLKRLVRIDETSLGFETRATCLRTTLQQEPLWTCQ